MPSVTLKNAAGKDSGTVELDADFFGAQPNVPVMHQVVTAQLAHRRAGTQSTKTRAEVSGGGRKPFKQKGTGNARQGSIRAPHYSGGGIALGPKPRKYDQKTPKKMIRLALRSALSDRANDGKVIVIDGWGFDAPSTKSAVAALGALGVDGSVLVVHGRDEIATIKSFRNLRHVQLIEVGELNAYDVLCNDTIVFTKTTLPGEAAEASASPESSETKAKRTSTETGDTASDEAESSETKAKPTSTETVSTAAAEGSASDEAESKETKAQRTSSKTGDTASDEAESSATKAKRTSSETSEKDSPS